MAARSYGEQSTALFATRSPRLLRRRVVAALDLAAGSFRRDTKSMGDHTMSGSPPPINAVPPPPPLPPPPPPVSRPARPMGLPRALPWYRTTWFVVPMLVIIFPLGLYLMWTSRPGWGVRANGIVTSVVTVLVVLIGVAEATATPPSKTASPVGGAAPSATASGPTSTQPPTTSVAAPNQPPTAAPTSPPAGPPAAPPTPARTAPAAQRPANLCGAPPNPWGYNLCGGSVIFSPPSNLCNYFNCIPSFWGSNKGYVAECKDGTYTHSGGRSSACSSHDGEQRPLYA